MSKTLRDPIYGSVTLSTREVAMVDSRAFQRLRHIHQLGLSHLVFHGAEHSRFGHSVGTLHTTTRALQTIRSIAGERLAWGADEADRYVALSRLGALLHDVGHPPFSHAAEAALPGGLSHEEMGKRILQETELGDTIDREYGDLDIERADVIDLWSGALPPNLRFLTDLISGNLDCDRMDYLLRDSHYAGVAYGRFDQERLLMTVTVAEHDGLLRLAVNEGGVYALESLILARYFMFLQVYFHKVRRLFDRLLERYVMARGGYPAEPDEFLSMNDENLWSDMEKSTDRWAQMIVRRRPFKEVYHSDAVADDKTMAAYRLKRDELMAKYGDEIILDDASTSTHKFELPYGPLSASGTPLTVVTDAGPVDFHERSHVVANLPTSVRWVRIFASDAAYDAVKVDWERALGMAHS
jgi:uncharacterized protein